MDADRRAEVRAAAESGFGFWLGDDELLWLLDAADERDALRVEVERLQAQRLQSVARVRKELRCLLEGDDGREALQWVLEEVLGD